MAIKPDTKKILANSLEDLLKTRSYEKITVQEIVDHCSASRSVFYRHFKDKQDLMQWLFRVKMEVGFTTYEESIQMRWESAHRVVEMLYEYRHIVKKLISDKGQNTFTDLLYEQGLMHTRNMLKTALKTEILPVELDASVKMFVGGVTYTLTDWIQRGYPQRPEDITNAIIDNCPARLTFILSNTI